MNRCLRSSQNVFFPPDMTRRATTAHWSSGIGLSNPRMSLRLYGSFGFGHGRLVKENESGPALLNFWCGVCGWENGDLIRIAALGFIESLCRMIRASSSFCVSSSTSDSDDEDDEDGRDESCGKGRARSENTAPGKYFFSFLAGAS